MNWFIRFLSCGRFAAKRDHSKIHPAVDGLNQMDLVSGITDADEGGTECDVSMGQSIKDSVSKIGNDYVRILLKKRESEPLGIRLKNQSTIVQSIEKGAALWKFSNDIPQFANICNVNGVVPTPDSIKQLLRDCRGLSTVFIAFSRKPVDVTLPPNAVGMSRRHGSAARMSHSSTSSAAGYSPTPSQLSTMWRRVSEVGSVPTETALLTQSVASPGYDIGGVTPIDFGKLSRDSMGMWTRQFSSRISFPSLVHPDTEDPGSNGRHNAAFDEELFSDSPNRKEARMRAANN